MTALVLKDVCKSFGAVEVLKNIDLAVADGEFVVFVGPSGCGKSTLLRVIAGLHRSLSATMIYVTHDQTEVMTLADRIVVLRDGRVEQIGSPMVLYNDPANRFVAGFLGAPAMNFLPAGPLGGPDAATLGIRPEHLRLADAGRIRGTVTHVENLGGDTNIIVETETGDRVTVRIFGQYPCTVGRAAALDFDDADAFLFDAAGARLEPVTA